MRRPIPKSSFPIVKLTREEEQELAKRIQAGDLEAKSQLVTANLRLVSWVAAKFLKHFINVRPLPTFDDVFQEGIKGLIHATEKFDPTRQIKFSTYATWWIRQSLREYVKRDGIIRVPSQIIYKTSIRCQHRMRRLIHKARRVTSISEHTPEIKDYRHKKQSNDDKEFVTYLLRSIQPRLARIIRLRYGIGNTDEEGSTLAEIGEQLGITRERVRQLEGRALKRLREQLDRELSAR